MAENIERRSRWSAPILDRHEDFIIAQRQAGASLRELQKSLRQRKTRASISTISRFIKSLPEERFQRTSQQAPTPPGKQRNSAAHYAIRSNGSRQKQPRSGVATCKSEREFSAARSSSTGKILGEPRACARQGATWQPSRRTNSLDRHEAKLRGGADKILPVDPATQISRSRERLDQEYDEVS